MAEIESLLKVSGCIIAELVPGQEFQNDLKTFTWRLMEFTQNKLRIKFVFDRPEIISVDKFDSIKITFQKTNFYLKPLD